MTHDQTEATRRAMIATMRLQGPQSREALEGVYGEVWNTDEMCVRFTVHSFMAPLCIVTRKADGLRGCLDFQHDPRLYYNFVPDWA